MVNPAYSFRLTLVLVGLVLVGGCNRAEVPVVEQTSLPSDDELRERIDRVIDFTAANRHLNTKDQAAWQIVHGILCYGRDYQIDADGQLVPALDYLLRGGKLRGWNMHKGDHGLEAIVEAGTTIGQGHEDQWLGYLSQCDLPITEQLVVGGETYTIHDLITQAQWDIHDGMEATWTLMAFSKYLPLDSEWTAKDGTKWNIERIVGLEADQDLSSSACGGTHRMYGLATAMNHFLASGGKTSGDPMKPWDKAHQKIHDAIHDARQNQQPDGSFSTNYFARPAGSRDIGKRISTSGHVLEFVVLAVDDEELKQPWIKRAATHLVDCFEKTQKYDLECGALYHAAHGLELYRNRRFGPRETARPTPPVQPPASESTAKG